MISIVIPIYNQADKLGSCLASIKAQSFQDFEVIVVNDGSTDDPAKVFKLFEQKFAGKIKYISQANRGSNPARNRGAKEAKGEYLLFCDADIVMDPQMLKTLYDRLSKSDDADYAYCSFKYGWKTFVPGVFSGEKLKKAPFIHTSALIKASKFPGFDEQIKRFQDWDLWLTMLEHNSKGVFVDQILFQVATGGTISTWLPSFVYKFLPWLKQVKKYKQAEAIIRQKHALS